MNEVLVNRLVKLANEKVWLGEMTIAVDCHKDSHRTILARIGIEFGIG